MSYKMKFGVKEIAAQVNKSERTIYRGLKIGIVEQCNSDWTTMAEYSTYKRGSNECEQAIRRFISKGADIKDYAKDVPKIMR